jgi:tetratricopeptide (TPR) repeat protein
MLDDAAYAYIDLGRYEAAQRYLDESRAIKLRFDQPPGPGFNHNATNRVKLALALGRVDDAERALADFAVHDVTPGGFSLNASEQDVQRADIALARKDYARAASLAHGARARIEAAPIAAYLAGPQARAELIEGRALVATGDPVAALPLLSNAAATRRRLLSPASPLRIETEVSLAEALAELGRVDEARRAVAAARDVAARNAELAPHYQRELQGVAELVARG